jgi:hypothetical protein
MGFLDKAKEAAEKAKTATQHAAQQGQAKIETMQQSKSEGELLKALGEAVYSEHRQGGGHDAVEAALSALDAHHAAVAAGATPPDASTGAEAPPAAPAPAAPGPPPAPAPAAPAGNFTLDDL